jgi:putative membrane protein
LLTLRPAEVFGHAGEPLAPHDLWWAWNTDPWILAGLALSATFYIRGIRRIWRHAPRYRRVLRRQAAFFATGWIALFVAVVSPVDALGSVLFTGHMVQHEILMLLAAPFLVLARPMVPFLWGLPFGWRKAAGRFGRVGAVESSWRFLTNPLVAWLLHALALWLWHVPVLFQATLASELVHEAQHLSFFGTALLFWWSLLASGRLGYGLAILYVFTTAVHNSMLGALLTFSPYLWYPVYSETTPAWGLTPLEDQQLGGLVMWVPGGVVYLVAALLFFGAWLKEAERRASGEKPQRDEMAAGRST